MRTWLCKLLGCYSREDIELVRNQLRKCEDVLFGCRANVEEWQKAWRKCDLSLKECGDQLTKYESAIAEANLLLGEWLSRLPGLATPQKMLEKLKTLYQWYVPPFRPAVEEMTFGEVYKRVDQLPGVKKWLRLDGKYYTTDRKTLERLIKWDWTDTKKYELDRFDCDKFAFYFKARMALDFGINAIGVVLDYSAAHAYNLLLPNDVDQPLIFEPQNDKIYPVTTRPSAYKMKEYVLLL